MLLHLLTIISPAAGVLPGPDVIINEIISPGAQLAKSIGHGAEALVKLASKDWDGMHAARRKAENSARGIVPLSDPIRQLVETCEEAQNSKAHWYCDKDYDNFPKRLQARADLIKEAYKQVGERAEHVDNSKGRWTLVAEKLERGRETRGVAYVNHSKGIIHVAFRGTDTATSERAFDDIVNDVALAQNKPIPTKNEVDFAKEVFGKYPDYTKESSGHSLGARFMHAVWEEYGKKVNGFGFSMASAGNCVSNAANPEMGMRNKFEVDREWLLAPNNEFAFHKDDFIAYQRCVMYAPNFHVLAGGVRNNAGGGYPKHSLDNFTSAAGATSSDSSDDGDVTESEEQSEEDVDSEEAARLHWRESAPARWEMKEDYSEQAGPTRWRHCANVGELCRCTGKVGFGHWSLVSDDPDDVLLSWSGSNFWWVDGEEMCDSIGISFAGSNYPKVVHEWEIDNEGRGEDACYCHQGSSDSDSEE